MLITCYLCLVEYNKLIIVVKAQIVRCLFHSFESSQNQSSLTMAMQRLPLLLVFLLISSLSLLAQSRSDTNHVYSPCADAKVQRSDGFSFGIAFSSRTSFFVNSSVQLSPCDKRLSLSSSNSQLAVFRPKVDEISLLTINTSNFFPVWSQPQLTFVFVSVAYIWVILSIICIRLKVEFFFVYLGKYGEMGLDLKWDCSGVGFGLGILVVGWGGGLRKNALDVIFCIRLKVEGFIDYLV